MKESFEHVVREMKIDNDAKSAPLVVYDRLLFPEDIVAMLPEGRNGLVPGPSVWALGAQGEIYQLRPVAGKVKVVKHLWGAEAGRRGDLNRRILELYGALKSRTGEVKVQVHIYDRSNCFWKGEGPPLVKIIPLRPPWSLRFKFWALSKPPATRLFLGNFREKEVELFAVDVPAYLDGAFGDGFIMLAGEYGGLHRLRITPTLYLEFTLHNLPVPDSIPPQEIAFVEGTNERGPKGLFVLSEGSYVAFAPSDNIDSLGWEVKSVLGEVSIYGIAPAPDGVFLYGACSEGRTLSSGCRSDDGSPVQVVGTEKGNRSLPSGKPREGRRGEGGWRTSRACGYGVRTFLLAPFSSGDGF